MNTKTKNILISKNNNKNVDVIGIFVRQKIAFEDYKH